METLSPLAEPRCDHRSGRGRVSCHRDFPAGCGPRMAPGQYYWSGSGIVSCNREFLVGCGGPPRIRVIETARDFFDDNVREENLVGSDDDDGVKGNKDGDKKLVLVKRGGKGLRSGVGSDKKRLNMMKDKEKEVWRRPINAVRSKPIVDERIKKPFASTSRAAEVSGSGNVDRAIVAVKETLRLYRSQISLLISGGRAGERERRIDFQAKKELEAEGKLKKAVKVVGAMPGVEVGDEFYYRTELFIIGLHGRLQNGIDYLERNGSKLATCVVATEGYYDDMTESEFLEYTGEGGVYMDKGKQPDDQKMSGGNLALKNSMMYKSPVRVVRGFKAGMCPGDPDPRANKTTYVYDGLYDVTDCKKQKASRGNFIYMFTLRRHPNQPVVRWRKYKH